MKTQRRAWFVRGVTLVELVMAITAGLVVVAGVYSFMRSSSILTAKCVSMNITGAAAHNAMDRMQTLLQLAYTTPVAIDSTGAVVPSGASLPITGTAAMATGLVPVVAGSNATISGTGNGIAFFRHVGSPYLVTVPTTGISASATQISFTCDATAQFPSLPPRANDSLVIYTTAILTGTDNQVWAKLASVTGTSISGNRLTYTASLTPPLIAGTAPVGISYQSNNQGNPVDVSAVLVRPTAFAVVNSDLRFYDSFLSRSGSNGGGTNAGMNLSGSNAGMDITRNYVTLTTALTLSGTVPPLDNNPTRFAVVTYGGRPFVGIILHLRSKNYDSFLLNKQASSFATYMGVGSLISLKSNP